MSETNFQSIFYIYTQSYMHAMRITWQFNEYQTLYYRNHQGLIPFAEVSYDNHTYFLNTSTKQGFQQHIVVKQADELIHILPLEKDLDSAVCEWQNEITIGRDIHNDIQIQSPYISLYHAKIKYYQQTIEIEDLGSRNGVYVNHKRIDKQKLHIGDIVHLPYMYIIIHSQCFILSFVQEMTVLKLKPFQQRYHKQSLRHFIHIQKEPFIHFEQEALKLSIKMPPQNVSEQKAMWMVLVPAMTMGVSTSFMMITSLQNDNLLSQVATMAMSGGMLLSTVLFPMLTHLYERKRLKEQQIKQEKAFNLYYDEKEKEMERKQTKYLAAYEKLQVNTTEAIKRIKTLKKLWQKDENSDDCLTLVLGEIEAKLPWELEAEALAIQLEYSNLEQRYQELLNNTQKRVKHSFYFDLKKERLLGIYGVEGLGYALQLLLQICATHDYRRIHLWICGQENDFYQWGIQYLPHVFSSDGMRRLLTTKEDFVQFQHQLRVKEDTTIDLLFLANEEIASFIALDGLLLEYPSLYVMQYAPTHQQLSSACVHIVYADKHQKVTYFHQQQLEMTYTFYAIHAIKEAMNQLSYIRWKKDQYSKPSFGFLALFSCQLIEQLQIEKRWQQKKLMNAIHVSLGYDNFQEKIVLNVHEKGHGPHGIIAGMTGSGKSEFIITFILSLCVQYSPQEVSFLLIDYKGGMSASVFQGVPHIAYVMTNLNDHSIMRVSLSLQAELERRQKLFAQCALKYHLGVVDIDQYWKLVYEGKCEPLPHLFVIADEFAELKSSHEAFLKLLKRISRIGRSLGLHLILATQKPSGIIDDEILSNSRFRVCLKVAYPQDSNDVLKHDDAAYLKEVGSFYLQIGNDELYIQGRCSYTQMPYHQVEDVQNKKISFHRYNGKAYLSKQISSSSPSQTQLQALVAYLFQLTKKLHLTSFHLCEKELQQQQQTHFHSSFALYLGELDDVHAQCRHPFYFAKQGNHLILGKSGSGKRTFIKTIVYEYARCSKDCCIYVLTIHNDSYDDLKQLAIVSDVIDVSHQEAYESFLYQLQHRQHQQKVIVVILMYERILEYLDHFQNDFMMIREGATQLIMSGFSSVGLPFRWLPYFEHRHLLQMDEKSEYTCIQNGTDVYPQKQAGSGITTYHHQPMLFQIYPYDNKLVESLPKGVSPYRIPLLPKHIPMLFRQGSFYLGKNINSKEDVFIPTHQAIIICAQYEIPPVFYHYVKAYEVKYHQQLDITLCDFNQLKSYQYDEAFQKKIRNASFIFTGSGLTECLYALPLPTTICKDLKENQLVCYVSQKLNYVAMMEEMK